MDVYFMISEWSDEMRSKKCKRKNLLGQSERKKKVALVSGTNEPSVMNPDPHPPHHHIQSPTVSCITKVIMRLTLTELY